MDSSNKKYVGWPWFGGRTGAEQRATLAYWLTSRSFVKSTYQTARVGAVQLFHHADSF